MKKDYLATYRLNLDIVELEILLENLDMKSINELIKITNDSESSFNTLKQKLENPIKIKMSNKKQKAVAEATSARSEKAREKIDNAINMLRFESQEITHYSISKFSKVAFVTVKKYVSDNYLKSLNEINKK